MIRLRIDCSISWRYNRFKDSPLAEKSYCQQ
nr:MAG TPA: hypothetical protein [Caudoviricetes sp.]